MSQRQMLLQEVKAETEAAVEGGMKWTKAAVE